MQSHFFAILSRMKNINRWSLMRNTRNENLCEHSYEVSVIAHALATLSNQRLNTNYNTDRAAILGLYHDASEIYTGDLPTPIKYYNHTLSNAYKEIEENSKRKLLNHLPDDIQKHYKDYLFFNENDRELWKLVKAADKLSALIKCLEENRMGNSEFKNAEKSTLLSLEQLKMPVIDIFIKEFIPSFSLTLDEQEKNNNN